MKRRISLSTGLLALPLLLSTNFLAAQKPAAAPNEAAKVSYDGNIKPFLTKYCIKCHGGERARADLTLEFSSEKDALKHREMWQKVGDAIHAGEMPPRNKPQPTLEEKDMVARWIEREVNKIDCSLPPDPGRVTLRRLNKAEYNNTIRDLAGVDFQPAADFPNDDVGYGFDNIGDVLTLSPLLLEKYLAAADKIVEAAWQKPETRRRIVSQEPKNNDDRKAAETSLRNFARRAYRRPVRDEEVERLLRFVDLVRKNGDPLDLGLKLAARAILVSPNFIFRVEKDRPAPAGKSGSPISEFELASRLSYFLWSSMPDEELFRQAEKNELRKNLEAQVRRMLADAKSRALVDNFAGQWLQLRNLRLKTVNPDPDRFPAFSEALRLAMIRETELFFEHLLREDRNLFEFLDADWTFVNERLAKHYGIPGVQGEEFRKVKLPNEQRGGVLTQASILTVTSNPTRTSPVMRGKWILENILNSPPPPPPPEVPELPDDAKAMASGSLRQRLELHRSNAVCASCHERMDPIGFGLENFNAIGGWRDRDGQFPIDAGGILPSGQKFSGPKELRLVLKTTKGDDFRRCLAEKMLTYALGRGLEYYDRCAVKEICESVSRNDNRFSSLVIAIIQSDPFQMRRGKRGSP